MTDRVVVIGGSVAGYTVVSKLRQHGHSGEITLIDPEGLPYERPPLSKQLLLGESSTEEITLAGEEWFAEHQVGLVHARAGRLQLSSARAEHTITLDDGASLTATTVVLATGAEPISLGVETTADSSDGTHPCPIDPRVLTLRHRDDVAALHGLLDEARAAGRTPVVALVGAGVLGAELASSLRNLRAEVVLFSGPGIPAAGLFGRRIATRLHTQHAEHGVSVMPEYAASVTLNTPNSPGTPGTQAGTEPAGVDVHTLSGAFVPADAVISAIGISPNTRLAEEAGLRIDDGVIVDAEQRSSHPDVFAVGDVARLLHHDRLARRTEHWQHAIDTAEVAAAVIAGVAPPAPGPEWFWSDRYGVHVEAIGSLRAAATETPSNGYTVVHREQPGNSGQPSEPNQHSKLATFVLDAAGRMLGAASIDDPLAVRAARRIIQRGLVVDPDRLADPEVSYKALTR
ncbi:MAG: NAD(P)/FAD-dependent oxidoreductase [Micrococcaceae bacterium]